MLPHLTKWELTQTSLHLPWSESRGKAEASLCLRWICIPLTRSMFGRAPLLSHLRFGHEVRCTRLTMKCPFTNNATRAASLPSPQVPWGQQCPAQHWFCCAGSDWLSGVPCASAFCSLVPDHLSSVPWWRALQKLPSLSQLWPLPTPAKAADSHCWPAHLHQQAQRREKRLLQHQLS